MGPGQDHRRRSRAAPRARLPRLNEFYDRLAAGYVPEADASVAVRPAPFGARAVVVGGTAWHVVAADVEPEWVAEQVARDPLAAPLGARFLAALADRVGAEPGVLDAVLLAPAAGVVPQPDIPLREMSGSGSTHARIARAEAHRTDVRVWTTPDDDAVLVLGRGVAGRWEVSLEVAPERRGRGLGTALVAAAPALVPDGAPLWAQVAPANTASLRAFLAAGYRPMGAEVLFGP